MNGGSPPTRQGGLLIVLAWCVHLYTALGLVCAAGMVVLLFRGDHPAFLGVFWLMLLATLIDATDGTMARAVHIKETVPSFDGRRLDDIVDFLTYVAIPLLLVWRANLLPAGTEVCLVLPLLASAYGFCQVSAKTDDGYFLGFPSYWNLVAFYLYALGLPKWLNLALLLILAVLVFVPSRYLYPSQKGRLNRYTNILGAAWTVVLAVALFLLGDPAKFELAQWLIIVSLYFPLYYFIASWAITMRLWRNGRRPESAGEDGGMLPVSPEPS